jgi:hypothetical protein
MSVRATLGAILDIVGSHVEIDREAGAVVDRSRPAAHHAAVALRDHPLLDDWSELARGRIVTADGALRVTRGRAALARLDDALARTMPLVDDGIRDGRSAELGRWLERFHLHVGTIRARAASEAVLDDIELEADRRLAREPCARLVRRLATPLTLADLPERGGPFARLGLERCLRELQRVARAIHGAAVRLEVALDATDAAPADGLAVEPDDAVGRALVAQTDGLRHNLRDLHLEPYLERVRAPRRHDDPGHHPPVRARLVPLLGLPSTSDADLLATCDCFVMVALACLERVPADTGGRPSPGGP